MKGFLFDCDSFNQGFADVIIAGGAGSCPCKGLRSVSIFSHLLRNPILRFEMGSRSFSLPGQYSRPGEVRIVMGVPDRELIRLTGEFADPELEAAYRRRHAPYDRLLARVIVGAAAITTLALGTLDYHFFPGKSELVGLWVARTVVFTLSVLTLYILRGELSPAAFEWRVGVWYCLTVALHAYVGSVWPAGHVELRMTAALTVLMSYCVMPLPLPLQTLGAILHTGAALVVVAWLNPLGDIGGVVGEAIWLVLINVLGMFLSYRLHARQRMLFAALLRQSELSSSLGKALAEVRTLRGLIRVCAWCHKVDTGVDWQQLEAYVRDHSHAEFTHGICPVCLETATKEMTTKSI